MAHEALIRGWQRLRGWVDQDREFLRTRERIAAQARLWEDEGKPPDRLLPPGRPLAEGEDLLATRRADLDADLITYVEVSAKAEEDAKRAEEDAKRAEEDAKRAEEDAKRAEEDAKRARRRRAMAEAIVVSGISGLVGESVYWAMEARVSLEVLTDRWAYLLGKNLPFPELVEIPRGVVQDGKRQQRSRTAGAFRYYPPAVLYWQDGGDLSGVGCVRRRWWLQLSS